MQRPYGTEPAFRLVQRSAAWIRCRPYGNQAALQHKSLNASAASINALSSLRPVCPRCSSKDIETRLGVKPLDGRCPALRAGRKYLLQARELSASPGLPTRYLRCVSSL